MSVSITGRQWKEFMKHLEDTSEMYVDWSTMTGTWDGEVMEDDMDYGSVGDKDELVITGGKICDGMGKHDDPVVADLVKELRKHFCKL